MELKPRTRKEFLIADFIDKDTPDIVPKTRSEMFLKQMLDKSSKPSWNDLTDKPFGEETKDKVLTCTIGDETLLVDDGKVVNTVSFSSALDGGYLRIADPISHDSLKTLVVTGYDVFSPAEFWDAIVANGLINDVFAFAESVIVTYEDNSSVDGTVFPNAGLYMSMDLINFDGVTSVEWKTETIKTIDQKYLPVGATIFYGNLSDTTLYKDANFTEKVMREDLLSALDNGALYIRNGSYNQFFTPTFISAMSTPASVEVFAYHDGDPSGYVFYTGEEDDGGK